MSMNNWTGIGRLTKDPELKIVADGVSKCSFTLAVDRDYSNKSTGERECDFINVVAWRSKAEFVEKYFSKGRMMGVRGRLQMRKWEDDNGVSRTIYEISAEDIYFCGDKRAERSEEDYSQDVPDGNDYVSGFAALDEDVPF